MSAERVVEPSTQVVEENAEKLEAALAEATRRFGVDLDAVDKPASNVLPMR